MQQLKDITRVNNDTTKITNLDVSSLAARETDCRRSSLLSQISETTETTMKLQLIDLSNVEADLSRQIEQQDALVSAELDPDSTRKDS